MNAENTTMPCKRHSAPGRSLLACGGLILAFTAPGFVQAAPLIQYNFNDAAPGSTAVTTAANSGSLGTSSNLTFTNVGPGTGIVWGASTPSGTGSALQLSGINTTALAQGNASDLNTGLSAFTITMWVKMTSTPAAADRLISVGATDTSHGFELKLNSVASLTASFALSVDGASITNTSATKIDLSAWTFLAATYDGSSVSFYNGGTSVSAAALGSSVTLAKGNVDAFVTTANALRVGSTPLSTDRTAPSVFDDVRIYGSALDLAAIQAVQAEVAVPEPSSAAMVFAGASLVAVGVARRGRR